ncbi:Transposable element Tc1 transposase [Araneus ventricosus]|uniref:Transposable element Tc1 transposase n=1 Tax=Araneus ventricosus TaxID=182803 RepID=A0A4Y2GHY0_ARAVE|nr:Transposable element Tc1 transposase [Araneus ventricosus]
MQSGDTSSRRQGVGRPRIIKAKGRRRLSRLVKQNRRQTVAQLTAQYNTGPSVNVSEHTVQRTLLDMGLCSRRPTRVPLLTKRHRQLRLQWAREHRDWTMDEWKRVAWSDESQFRIHHADGRVRVRRMPGELLFPSCTAGHTQAGGGGIMLWGTFSWAAMGPVVVVERTMKAVNYLSIIADQLHLYMEFVFPTGNRSFQQDNAPCHKARIVLEWFEEHTDEFHLMSWPPNSPDINPMEHIWNRTIYGFIIDHREFFTASELLPDWPTKRFRPLSLTVNMLENVAKRKLIKMQEENAPLHRASYMIFYSVYDTDLPSIVGYSAITHYFFKFSYSSLANVVRINIKES